MKLLRVVLIGSLLAMGATAAGPATAGKAPKMKVLGTDPSSDGPPALDVTSLAVGRVGDDLEIRIGVAGMLPAIGGYPEIPGIEWIFDVGSKTFLAEAYVSSTGERFRFLLFEVFDDGYKQLDPLEGTYDSADGYISLKVPLEAIGARKGTKISGTGPPGTPDVDAHLHIGTVTLYPDTMATTKDFVVP
ncbi:MAG: hypothetical protein M3345_04340 [Actinomycetota bacterium]|nr:hypothetical protein [Actinomycetota bacterium]